jgi:hypothetical protein
MNVRKAPIARSLASAGVIGAATLTLSSTVLAQGNSNKPPTATAPAVSLAAAKPNPVVFSRVTTLSGRVTAPSNAPVEIRFEEDTTRPYGDSYKMTALRTTTKSNGMYSLAVKPTVNTQYRAIAQLSPPVRSTPRLVLVRTLVGLKLSDGTPRRGSLVTFSGSVYPAHDGQRALIQRRSPSGRFLTIARPLLRDAGTTRSAYSRRIRLFRDGAYRVKVVGDADHVNGFSRTRAINVATG